SGSQRPAWFPSGIAGRVRWRSWAGIGIYQALVFPNRDLSASGAFSCFPPAGFVRLKVKDVGGRPERISFAVGAGVLVHQAIGPEKGLGAEKTRFCSVSGTRRCQPAA